jgi:hypothetical protein
VAATTVAVVAVIPGPLGRRLAALRRRLGVEDGSSLPAHIPLVGPFLAEPPFLPLEQHCWRVCHETAPFDVELGPLAVDEEEGFVYAEIASGREQLVALREALLTGAHAPSSDATAYTPRAVVAHLQRADDIAPAERELAGTVTDAPFFLERVELLAQYPDGSWYERDFYTLDWAVTPA